MVQCVHHREEPASFAEAGIDSQRLLRGGSCVSDAVGRRQEKKRPECDIGFSDARECERERGVFIEGAAMVLNRREHRIGGPFFPEMFTLQIAL